MPFDLQMTDTFLGISSVIIFVFAYCLVMGEELLSLPKSKPVVFAAGLIWVLVAIAAKSKGVSSQAQEAVKHNLLEYGELLLFLLVAMTYVNAMEERKVFEALRCWLVRKQFSYRSLFWITGFLAFFISPFADNLTTALIMCAIIMAVGLNQPRFIAVSCINIVVAANSGGAFCPFGDITTLMVWQKGVLPFTDFFKLFIPALVSFVIPALCMHFAIPKGMPASLNENIKIARGGIGIVILFLMTILTAVCLYNFYNLPPTIGMMMGLAYINFLSYYLKMRNNNSEEPAFNVFENINRIEWDTLLFFYGVVLCVGGLAAFGYLHIASETMYTSWGASLSEMHRQTPANVTIGILSAIVDNIPLMYAVLTMKPAMSEGQWLLITLTAGIGGSLLSVGSAAGVALMGQSKGNYTFMSHLKWSWAILLGYFAAVFVHFWVNKGLF
ncbi:MAG: sodium:proton antiporter NhaD [Gammaproteobacteria bacterium]|jgi:Na+/H+ antiporter NhaD/arsenite permease-like protein|nr:sodium:proton antiporter NhaD [Gammaproteobacteria bacterium]